MYRTYMTAAGRAAENATPGFLVWRLSMKWRVALDRALAPLGLTHAQYSLLGSLYGMGQAVPTQRELADYAGLEPLYTSKLARTLETAGLIQRTPHALDSRARQLTLTPQGRAVTARAVDLVATLLDEHLLKALGGLSGARTAEFTAMVRELLDQPVTVDPPS